MTFHIDKGIEELILRGVEKSDAPEELFHDLATFLPRADVRIRKKGVKTAQIRRSGDRFVIEFGAKFLQDYCKAPEDTLFVFLHECFHHVLGHFAHNEPEKNALLVVARQIAADIEVNREVCRRFFAKEGVPLVRKLYDLRDPVQVLLRPPQAISWREQRILLREFVEAPAETIRRVEQIYFNGWYQAASLESLVNQVFQLLKRLEPARRRRLVFLVLIGSHRGDGIEDFPWKSDSNGSSYSEEEEETQVEVNVDFSTELAHAVRSALIEDLNRQFGSVSLDVMSSPLFSMGRRDLVFLTLSVWPGLFHIPQQCREIAHVYVDVSASVNKVLPRLLGFLVALRDLIGPKVFQFSNRVVEVSLEKLEEGFCATTWGTDFDCVVEHALQNNFRRLVIITDGCAELEPAMPRLSSSPALPFFSY